MWADFGAILKVGGAVAVGLCARHKAIDGHQLLADQFSNLTARQAGAITDKFV